MISAGLSYGTDEYSLREAFEKYGAVTEGLVEYAKLKLIIVLLFYTLGSAL